MVPCGFDQVHNLIDRSQPSYIRIMREGLVQDGYFSGGVRDVAGGVVIRDGLDEGGADWLNGQEINAA